MCAVHSVEHALIWENISHINSHHISKCTFIARPHGLMCDLEMPKCNASCLTSHQHGCKMVNEVNVVDKVIKSNGYYLSHIRLRLRFRAFSLIKQNVNAFAFMQLGGVAFGVVTILTKSNKTQRTQWSKSKMTFWHRVYLWFTILSQTHSAIHMSIAHRDGEMDSLDRYLLESCKPRVNFPSN